MKDGIIKADGTSRLARSVADFKAKYPNYDAFASALVAGTLPLDILFNEAGWTQLPDFLNKANLLKDGTAVFYGLDGTAVPDDVLVKALDGMKWTLIQEYRTAGAYTFTVPEGVYEIGVYMTGAGGSGSAVAWTQSAGSCAGGGSGYGKNLLLSVTPGQTISIVVGKGGAAVTTSGAATSAPAYAVNGNNGGSTSVNGVTVAGGSAGSARATNGSDDDERYAPTGAAGGQPSDDPFYRDMETGRVLYAQTPHLGRGTYVFPPAREQQNAFDPTMITLCAGGYNGQTLVALPDGTKGGDTTNPNATGNGNGGAGVGVTISGKKATSGKGSDGMVLIYKRGV